jgi:hypothetical protein
VAVLNEAVLQAIEEHALTPKVIDQVILLAERDDVREQEDSLERQERDLNRRIARVVEAIEAGGEVASLVEKLRTLEGSKAAAAAQRASLKPIPRLSPQVVEDHLAEWRRLLRASTTQGRAVLQRILASRIVFTPLPSGKGYTFTAETRFSKLFSGVTLDGPHR